MMQFLTMGAVLGLAAGFAPGPILTLVLSETLRHGVRAGVKVAFVPVFTDLPIIAVTLFLLSRLSDFHAILGIISLMGGAFVLWMGYSSMRTTGAVLDPQGTKPRSVEKGIVANVLNPHPYLFWFSVGAPTVTRAMAESNAAAAAFLLGFYALLVGSKVVLAMVTGRSRAMLSGKAYLFTVRGLGVLLCVLALMLFRDGLVLLTIL